MIAKKLGVHYLTEVVLVHDMAVTMPVHAVTDEAVVYRDEYRKVYTKTHEDGWTISGVVQEDWYLWVNEFEASHPIYGRVQGDFETEVLCDSEEGFAYFFEHHGPEVWDYQDI